MPHSHREFGSGRNRRSGRPCPRPDTGRPASANLYICLVRPPGSADRPSVSAPALLEFRQVALDSAQNRCVCVSRMPPSAIMITKSLKLNLKLVYQATHRMMICPSKCLPFNRTSTGTNGCILPSSPIAACLHQNRMRDIIPKYSGSHCAAASDFMSAEWFYVKSLAHEAPRP